MQIPAGPSSRPWSVAERRLVRGDFDRLFGTIVRAGYSSSRHSPAALSCGDEVAAIRVIGLSPESPGLSVPKRVIR